jgi:hypothetical protein
MPENGRHAGPSGKGPRAFASRICGSLASTRRWAAVLTETTLVTPHMSLTDELRGFSFPLSHGLRAFRLSV